MTFLTTRYHDYRVRRKKNKFDELLLKNHLNNVVYLIEKAEYFKEVHPVFTYIKALVDQVNSKQFERLVAYGREFRYEYNDLVPNPRELVDLTTCLISYKDDEVRYINEDFKINRSLHGFITPIWKLDRLYGGLLNIGSNLNNPFNDNENSCHGYIYPIGIAIVDSNGTHSNFVGSLLEEGEEIHCNHLEDISQMYSKIYFDGTYYREKETKKIIDRGNDLLEGFKECGILFEIGRILKEHPEVFPKEIQNTLSKIK